MQSLDYISFRSRYATWLLIGALALASACQENTNTAPPPVSTLFTEMPSGYTGISFVNQLDYDREFNIFTYRNFYNGGGVAIGDLNNDGLPDLYFTANRLPNRLYLNKGNFQFEDITEKAGVAGKRAWSTGVSLADVNGDGWLDIYVCNSGDIQGDNKQNELFINNGDLTFTEQAEAYGLADAGLSTHAAFFDYDKDGDLDLYLLNNSYRAIGSFNLKNNEREVRDAVGGDKLLRNDSGKFVDVSEAAGIYGSVIGFGLGVTVGDLDGDDWQDIYVSNDFFERDYIYLNNHDGTFREVLEAQMNSISGASMGADMGDINNDGRPDIFVTEMLPEDDKRLKTKTTFENWDKYQFNLQYGYYHQFTRNMLHLNNGDGTFSEIGRLAGVHATDWSWGALIQDFDNDGQKDIFVANGIHRDLTDQDYILYISNEEVMRSITSKNKVDYQKLIDAMPSVPIPNYLFANQGGYRFENKAAEWGLATPSHSNGSAYGDLDNDGDLDLVVNNLNMPAFVYRNETDTLLPERHWLRVAIEGEGNNTQALGTKVTLYAKGKMFYLEHMPVRGFESTMDGRMHFGLGEVAQLDSLVARWPDGRKTVLTNVAANQEIRLKQQEAKAIPANSPLPTFSPFFQPLSGTGLDFTHTENPYSDFDRERLLVHMNSTQGPKACVGDFNGDGKADVYIGGAAKQAGALFIQSGSAFRPVPNPAFEADKASEDVACACFDADRDGDLDLYVGSGGSEFNNSSTELLDRLYLNNGKGVFTRANQALPISEAFIITGAVAAHDVDGDGDTDLFVGTRQAPGQYGVPVGGFLLENDGKGNLKNVTATKAPDLAQQGMATDAAWMDVDGDGSKDLVVVGEWMPVRVYRNEKGRLTEITEQVGTANLTGWWNSIAVGDLNGDGKEDLVLGNHGLNSRFKASPDRPISLYVNDFDANGTPEQIMEAWNGDRPYPIALRHDLVMQIPSLKKKYLKYEQYQGQGYTDIFTSAQQQNTVKWGVTELRSMVLLNEGGKFTALPLPVEAQLSPLFGLQVTDANGDGFADILAFGNFDQAKPEFGRYDASWGLLLAGDGKGQFRAVPSTESGIRVRGAVRDLQPVRVGNQNWWLIVRNNGPVEVVQQIKPAAIRREM